MNPTTNQEHDEAQEILEALRQIQDNAELKAEAAKSPESLLDRLNLSGIARSAVALGIAGLTVAAHGAQKLFGWWGGPGMTGWTGAMNRMRIRPAVPL